MKYDICVFGGCSLDQFYYRYENGEVSNTPYLIMPGGKGSNQAVAAARAGAKVTIISKIGKDDVGQRILENLVYNNISTNNVEVIEGLQNDFSKIIIDIKTKENEINRITGAIDSFTPDMIETYKKVLLKSKIVVAQLKVPKEVSIALINFCHANNIPLILTPCRPQKLSVGDEENHALIDKITYITANQKECQTIFGTDNIEECLRQYPNKLIVTLGDKGVMYHDGTKIIHLPANKVDKIEDTTGAGDTFNGNLAASLAKGLNLRDAIFRAQFASSMKIQKKGAQDGMPYQEELDSYIMNQLLNDNDYMSEFDLAYAAIINAAKAIEKKSIVNVRIKEDASFVTESDLIVEKLLIDDIISQYPHDNFVTEEFNNENTITNRTWIIDPIDGTAHYMKNSLFWGIQMAFVDRGEVQFSIIYLPKLDEMYYSIRGKGTFLNHQRIIFNEENTLNKSIIEFCGSPKKMSNEKQKLFEKLLQSNPHPANFLHINSCSFAFTNLLAGRTDTMILSTIKAWDILPGILMVEEAGFKTYNYQGLKIYSNTKDFETFLKD